MKSFSFFLMSLALTWHGPFASSQHHISFTEDDKEQEQQQQEESQNRPVSTEDLFDMLVPNNTISSKEDEESFPPLSVVEHYALSWTVVMSFSKHTTTMNNNGYGVKTTTSRTLDDLFWDSKSQFKFQFEMKCPSASRMVIGLIDNQGKKRHSQQQQQEHQTQTSSRRNSNNHNTGTAPLHEISCGPPIDMSRNILQCRGIPGDDSTLQQQQNTNNVNQDEEELHQDSSSSQRRQQQQFIFQANLEVSCLGYVDISTYKRSASAAAGAGRDQNDDLPRSDFLGGLTISTPKQQQIRSRSDDLILTESFHATRIINLTQYLLEPSSSSSSSDHDDPTTISSSKAAATDSSGFVCQRGAAVNNDNNNKDTTTTSSSSNNNNNNNNSGMCNINNNKSVGSSTMMEPTNGGLCTRQLTCYYSAPSPRRSCTSNIESLVLSSSSGSSSAIVGGAGPANRRRRRRRKLLQQKLPTQQDERSDIESKKNPSASLRQQAYHLNQHPSHNHNNRHLTSKKKKTRLHHEARYRLLWSAFNFGCDGFPIMMDISCSNAAFISFQGSSSSSIMRSGRSSSSSSSLTTAMNLHQMGGNNNFTYWDGSGERLVVEDEQLQHQFSSLSSSSSSSSLECFDSLFQENTIHCRRSVPGSMPSTSSSSTKKQYSFYQEVLALDISCTQAIDSEEEVVPNIIHASTVEASNIQCPAPEEEGVQIDKTKYNTQAPAQVGSALTIVPVTAMRPQEGVGSSGRNNTGNMEEDRSRSPSNGGNFVIFPPPQSGSTVDPTSSVNCSSCLNSYDFYVNYDNSIGNKVAQLVKGCLTIAACQLGSRTSDNNVNEAPNNSGSRKGRGCINIFPPTTISYQDNDNSQFLSYLYEVPSSSSSKQHTRHGHRGVSILFSVATTFALMWIGT